MSSSKKVVIDFSKLADQERAIEARSSGPVMRVSKIANGGSINVRLLPDVRLNGGIMVEVQSLQAGKSTFIRTNVHFDQDCSVMAEYEDALKSDNPEIRKNAKKLKVKYEYYIPVLLITENKAGDVTAIEEKFLAMGTQTYKGFLAFVNNAKYRGKSPLGVLDPKEGRSFIISKKGEGLDTVYTVVAYPDSTDMTELASDFPVITKAYDQDEMASLTDYLAEHFDSQKELMKLNEFLETGSTDVEDN